MFTIRGENVYPSEIDSVLNGIAGYGGEHQMIITREGVMDELLLRVEADMDTLRRMGADEARFRMDVGHQMHKLLGLRVMTEVVERGILPRTDFKARRVVDDRAVFRELYTKMEHERGA
jgi:phenylacetate-CoA ligase